eukprot:6230059-Amphidinium_carterae.1
MDADAVESDQLYNPIATDVEGYYEPVNRTTSACKDVDTRTPLCRLFGMVTSLLLRMEISILTLPECCL